MKKQKTIYLTLILTISILGTSCVNWKTFKDKNESEIAFLRSITPAEKNLIEASRSSKCTEKEKLAALKSCKSNDGECKAISLDCCLPKNYCGVDVNTLKKYIKIYRNEVWSKTSPYFPNNGYTTITQPILDNIYNNVSINNVASNFDARFMDMEIDDLQAYLCSIKNNPGTSNYNTLRFYFIRYPNITQSQVDNNSNLRINQSNKHSLAILPANVDYDGSGNMISQSEFTKAYNGTQTLIWIPGQTQCDDDPAANHNMLCPPFGNCDNLNGTLIKEVDQ